MAGILKGKLIACDTETTGLSPWLGHKPFGFSFCNADGETAYLDAPVDPTTREPQYSRGLIHDLRSVYEDRNIVKVFFNAKFDRHMVERVGIETRGTIHEVKIAARLCNSLEPDYKLKRLAKAYADIDDFDESDLHDEVVKLRRQVPDDWLIGEKVEQDYWLPKAFNPKSTLCETYAKRDAFRTMVLWLLYEELLEDEDLRKFYDREMKLWHTTFRMEKRGIGVNLFRLKTELAKARESMQLELNKLRELSENHRLNPNSDNQLREELFGKRKLPVYAWTKTGLPSTAAENIVPLTSRDEFAASLLRYRSYDKARGYFENYLTRTVREDLSGWEASSGPQPGRWSIHPTYDQAGTKTGRYASSNPNFQNVSHGGTAEERGVVAFHARVPFGPRPGFSWLLMDYSQLEARLFAYLADEQFMLKAFARGRDLHAECANKAWGGDGNPAAIRILRSVLRMDSNALFPPESTLEVWERYGFRGAKELDRLRKRKPLTERAQAEAEDILSKILDEYGWDIVKAEKSLVGHSTARYQAKRILFCKIFGGGATAAARQLHCSIPEARRFMKEYDSEFPRIRKYIRSVTREAERDGYIYNLFGRKLMVRPGKGYTAANHSVQSLAADLMKLGLIECDEYLLTNRIQGYAVCTVHDELIFEVHESELLDADWNLYERTDSEGRTSDQWETASPLVKALRNRMEDSQGIIDIPTPVDVEITGSHWEDTTPVKLLAS